MQPITVDLNIISQLFQNPSDIKSLRDLFKFSENLEKYHTVYVDKNTHGSVWLDKFIEIRNSINDHNIRDRFDLLLGPKTIKYIPIDVEIGINNVIDLTKNTPDKIGVAITRNNYDDVVYYDTFTFNSDQYDINNYLYRIPKNVTFKPNDILKNTKLFSPYLRTAKKIEFCDPFLFKNPRYSDDFHFLFFILKTCGEIQEIEIHTEPNKLNIMQLEFEKRIKSTFGPASFKGFKQYNPPKSSVNHDRFIIVDHDRYSIRFTTSFNNFRLMGNDQFRIHDSFLVEFSTGRKYFD